MVFCCLRFDTRSWKQTAIVVSFCCLSENSAWICTTITQNNSRFLLLWMWLFTTAFICVCTLQTNQFPLNIFNSEIGVFWVHVFFSLQSFHHCDSLTWVTCPSPHLQLISHNKHSVFFPPLCLSVQHHFVLVFTLPACVLFCLLTLFCRVTFFCSYLPVSSWTGKKNGEGKGVILNIPTLNYIHFYHSNETKIQPLQRWNKME